MRNPLPCLITGSLIAALSIFSHSLGAQNHPQSVGGNQAPKAVASAGPAPMHDVSGVWLGPVIPVREPVPAMTPAAQAIFDSNKPNTGPRGVEVALSNDPLVLCDPLGFPRNVLFETRGFEISQEPKRVLVLYQYQRVWREIWTDGRTIPADIGGDAANSPDPRWYGYSVGKWADDYTFVINSTGMDDRSWLDEFGHPHSVKAQIEERYRRVDANHLELTVNVNDPDDYTKPFEAMKQMFQLSAKDEMEEQLCVPSEAQQYLNVIARPAAAGKGEK
jgi:hypothetical protein